jgi:DNA repair protein RadC
LTPKDVWQLCIDIKDSKKEHFIAFYLDSQKNLIEREIISVGILDASLVHPREVFEPAVRFNAGSVIVAHNHPSGVLEPSPEDKAVTKRLKQSAEILGIEIEDHVIITSKSFYSFKKEKML